MAKNTAFLKSSALYRVLALVCVSLVLTACGLNPHYERPDLDLPDSEQSNAEKNAEHRSELAGWWRRFDDPVLNQLINSALENNLDIALQTSQLQQARAELGLAKSAFYPTLGAQAQASRSRASLDANPQLAGSSRYSTNYSVAATLDYELNLFSALSGKQAAKAQLLAAAYAHDAIRLSVVGDVVAGYMSLRDVQRQIRIMEETIDSREDDVNLAKKKYNSGAINRLELLQKQALLASALSQIPQLKQSESELESSLALLTGQSPRELMEQKGVKPGTFHDITLPKELPEVIPSELVNRRPDIRAAEAGLVAANAGVSQAKSNYFPSINLTGLVGSSAGSTGDLFTGSSSERSIVGGLIGPLFTFGRTKAQVKSAEARKEQAEIRYRQTVRQAFKEVRDALIGIKITEEREQADRDEVEAYQDTYEIAQNRYDSGQVGLQELLDAQRQLLNAQVKLSDTIRARYVATANLFKALGGGWDEDTTTVPDNIKVGLPEEDDEA